ncbi:glycosyltransferase [Novosphingobium sp. BL-8A]|uniref:glycosyltransferase n=1 Tax=Novosphingobium sp. BL-8A TaxID=3127639 RepID=UPI003757F174
MHGTNRHITGSATGGPETPPLRVLYVVPPSKQFAGIERVTDEIASALATFESPRFDVSVLYFRDYPEVVDPAYSVIRGEAERTRHIPGAVQRVLDTHRFDLVVIPQFEIAFLCMVQDRLRGRRTHIVLHLHGNPEIERAVSLKSRVLFAFLKPAAPRFAGVIAVSPGLARHASAMMGGGVSVEHMPNPVRQLGDHVRVGAEALAGRNFVTVARLAYQKGHDIAITAFRRVVDAYPDARLTIVGEGPERPKLEALIARLGLQDNVRLAGMVANPSAELASARAFVTASRWEGFGVAIVEAMSVGLPVVAAKCDFGPEDLIVAPELGELAEPNNPDGLAEAMIRQLAQEPRAEHVEIRRRHAAESAKAAVVARHAAYLADLKRSLPA